MFKFLTIMTNVVFLSACTQKFNDVNATLDEALFGVNDAALTQQEVLDIPYASSFVRINGGAKLFMVLAFAEPNPVTGVMQLKWLSSDRAMIVTENGRIIKTLGLPQSNLAVIHPISGSTATDFSSLPSFSSIIKQQTTWSAQYDWISGEQYLFGYHAEITPILREKSRLKNTIWEKEVTEIIEVVSIPSLNYSYSNQYWVDKHSNVVKSHQYLGPNMGEIEMTFLKSFSL